MMDINKEASYWKRGYLLVEIMVAITIITVALGAIGGLVVNSSKSLAANDITTLAYKAAQARLESLKSVPANNWAEIGFTNTYQNVTTAITAVTDATTRVTLQNNIITATTPTGIDARITLTTEGRTSPVISNRLVQVRVIANYQTGQVELVTLFGRDP